MSIALIPFWIPLLWALVITTYWRIKMKEPINHWVVCLLVFAINFFWFAFACVFFLAIAVINFLIKKEDESNKK